MDGILLTVQGEDDLCDMLKMLDWGVCGEGIVPDEEHKYQEETELDYPAMAYSLSIFAVLKAEFEPQLDQVGDMADFWVR